MTQAQLQTLFPDGKTLHIPSNGRVLSQAGYAYAQEQWNQCHAVPCTNPAALRGGAQAMGFTNSGILQVGADADLILIDMDKPHLVPRHNLAANIVHSARGSDVNYVIVNGQVLLRKGELTTLDEERIMHLARERGLEMVSAPLKQTQTYNA